MWVGFFFFNDAATTEFYTLSLHDALPIWIEWRGFGDVRMNLEVRLSVEDSPNSAGVVIDALRCAKLALDRGISGPLEAASACAMKHPPRQMRESEAREALERFIAGE